MVKGLMEKKTNKIYHYFYEIVLTLLVAFCFTTLIILLAGAPPFSAYYHIFLGLLGIMDEI